MDILPASAERIAEEVGGELLERYTKVGLTVYRTIIDEDTVVEGYLEEDGTHIELNTIDMKTAQTQR